MKSRRPPLLALAATVTLSFAAPRASAGVQKFPFQFDPNLDSNPTAIQQSITQGEASLPALPVSELVTTTVDSGNVTLWFWPDSLGLLQNAVNAGPGPMTWPTTPVMCAKTAAFTVPTILLPDAGATCANADASIRQELADVTACSLVERPEQYVYGYEPTDVANDVGSIEDMVGLAGEALTHGSLPPAGLLPTDFVPTLRVILDKIRHDTLSQKLAQTKAAYAQAISIGTSNASCFDPTALAALTSSLGDLSSEVDAASAHIDNLKTTGEAAATQSTSCLAAKSMVRNTLPLPSLTDDERKFIAFWLGGVYWRMRGGGLIPLGSTQDARLYYVDDAFSQIGAVIGGQDGIDTAFPFFLEVIVDGWSQWMCMGYCGGPNDKYASLIGMTERGQRQAETAINVIGPRGYDTTDLMTGGLQMGPGYFYGWEALRNFLFDSPMPSPYSGFIDGPTAIGEFNMGASLGLGLAQSLLAGKPTGQPPTVTLCTGQACGDDGCGGSCGTCASGLDCVSGQCVAGSADAGAPEDGAAPRGADGGSPTSPGGADASTSSNGNGIGNGDGDGNGIGNGNGAAGGANSGCACRLGTAPCRAPGSVAGVLFVLTLVGRRRPRRGS